MYHWWRPLLFLWRFFLTFVMCALLLDWLAIFLALNEREAKSTMRSHTVFWWGAILSLIAYTYLIESLGRSWAR